MVFKYQDLEEIQASLNFNEESKVWEAEFESEVNLECLKIYLNLTEIWVNPCKMILEFYCDIKVFEASYEVYDKEILYVQRAQRVKKIKIYLENHQHFSIFNLKCFTRKYKGILTSITDDGLGCRLINMLVSWYLADLSGYKFGFVWNTKMSTCGTDDLRDNLQFYNYKILLPQMESEEYIFDSAFIEKHSYTKQIKREKSHLARNISLQKLKESLPFEGAFGWSYQDSGMHIIGVDKSYISNLPQIYSRIAFSPHILEIINLARDSAQSLGEFVALHFRGSDTIYDKHIRFSGIHYRKVMPIEIALEIIKIYLPQGNLVIFSDDIATLESLVEYAREIPTDFKLWSILEFLPKNLNEVDRSFFEFTFMSYGREIFSSFSHFPCLASMIQKGREHNYYFKFFNEKEQSKIILEHLEKIKIHPLAQAFSYLHLYLLKRAEGDFKFLENIACRAMQLDEENPLYKIAFLDTLLKQEKFKEAEELLANKGQEMCEVFCKCILTQRFQDIAQGIFKNVHLAPSIMEFAREIAPSFGKALEKGAELRVREQLSYKLGEAYLQGNLLTLPFRLIAIKREHQIIKKMQKKMIERGELKPPKPLHSFVDYFKALEIQKGREFKIGQEIMKADKSFLKWGFFTLYFKCKNYREI